MDIYNRSKIISHAQRVMANWAKGDGRKWSSEHLVPALFPHSHNHFNRRALTHFGWATPQKPLCLLQVSFRKASWRGRSRLYPKEAVAEWGVESTFLSSPNASQHLMLCCVIFDKVSPLWGQSSPMFFSAVSTYKIGHRVGCRMTPQQSSYSPSMLRTIHYLW